MTVQEWRFPLGVLLAAVLIAAVSVSVAISTGSRSPGPSGATPTDGTGIGAALHSQDACSIVSMATEYGIDLGQAGTATKDAEALALEHVHADAPAGTVAEQVVAAVKSANLPVVDGHIALIVRIEGGTGLAGGSPGPSGVLSSPEPLRCALSIFDADSGEFLVNLKDYGP